MTGGAAIAAALPRSRRVAIPAWLQWLSFPVGAAVIVLTYQLAARGQSGAEVFILFWVGIAVACGPAIRRVVGADTPQAQRLALLIGIGLITFLPKYLRDPSGPLFHDELAHWREIHDSIAAGHLMQPNPIIPIIQHFPGLHAAVIALQHLTGASTFAAGEGLLLGLHVGALLGVYEVARRVLRNQRLAGVAAIVYALNPGFMFFDVQLAYESLGIVLAIWTVALSLAADQSDGRTRWGAIAAACLTGAACVVTHHLSSYFLVLVLAALAVASTVSSRGAPTRRLISTWTVPAVVAGTAVAWAAGDVGQIWHYIAPYLTAALAQLTSHTGGGATHHPFHGSSLPVWEQALAYAAPVVAFAAVLYGVHSLIKGGRWTPQVGVFSILAAMYFVSLPFILASAGNEGARRSWSFSYLGVAVVMSLAVERLLARRTVRARRIAAAIVVATVATLAVGNVAASVNEEYRFPGNFVYGSDTRSLTPELRGLYAWFDSQLGVRNRVLADRSTGLVLGTLGQQTVDSPSPGFPVWELYLSSHPSQTLVREVALSGWRWLVVDAHQSTSLPRIGFYVDPKEPGALDHLVPPAASLISRYEQVRWAAPVFRTANYTVYRLDLPALWSANGDPFAPAASAAGGQASGNGTGGLRTASQTVGRLGLPAMWPATAGPIAPAASAAGGQVSANATRALR
jgi:hypothetical protein